MLIGHYGLALAAKRLAPRTSLGVLFLASMLLDLLAQITVPLGLEEILFAPGSIRLAIPVHFVRAALTHSFLVTIGWALLFGGAYKLVTGNTRGAAVSAALVLSHWPLDVLMHGYGLPIYPGGPGIGLGAWRSLPLTLVLELALYFLGIAVYLTTTRPLNRSGTFGFAVFLALMAAAYFFALSVPQEPSLRSFPFYAVWNGMILLAYGVDRGRTAAGFRISDEA